MPRLSAGLLLYELSDSGMLRVLLVHPGGPFWARKDEGAWSVPKGEYLEGEDPHAVAIREFTEELGNPPLPGHHLALGEIRQPSGKRVTVWAREGTFDASTCVSNTFELEWPRGSGRIREFPEVDRAEWFELADARQKLHSGQVPFLDRLIAAMVDPGITDPPVL